MNDIQTVKVALFSAEQDRSYPIHIGKEILERVDLLLPHLLQKRVAIVTNTTVAPFYLDRLRAALEKHGILSVSIVLPDGEDHKNWQTLNLIFDALLEQRCERKTALIALGGGVIGQGLRQQPICGACPLFRFLRHCLHKWILRWAVRRASTIRLAKI